MLYKGINIRTLEAMIAIVENEFVAVAAGIDLGTGGGQVTIKINQLESALDYQVFERVPLNASSRYNVAIGLTDKGKAFHDAAKAFIDAIGEIDSDGVEL